MISSFFFKKRKEKKKKIEEKRFFFGKKNKKELISSYQHILDLQNNINNNGYQHLLEVECENEHINGQFCCTLQCKIKKYYNKMYF